MPIKLRFSLRTWLISIATITLILGTFFLRVERQRQVTLWIEKHEGIAFCENVVNPKSPISNIFHSVNAVWIPYSAYGSECEQRLKQLPHLENIVFFNSQDCSESELDAIRSNFSHIQIDLFETLFFD